MRAPIAQIGHLRLSKVTVSYLLRPAFKKGIIVTLADGDELALPLDFKERDEILQRLRAITGKGIDD